MNTSLIRITGLLLIVVALSCAALPTCIGLTITWPIMISAIVCIFRADHIDDATGIRFNPPPRSAFAGKYSRK